MNPPLSRGRSFLGPLNFNNLSAAEQQFLPQPVDLGWVMVDHDQSHDPFLADFEIKSFLV
jgi:hypothetical protein